MPQPQPNLTRRGLFGNGLWAAVVAGITGLSAYLFGRTKQVSTLTEQPVEVSR